MIKELIKLATHLDERGLVKEADYLDVMIEKIANEERARWADYYDNPPPTPRGFEGHGVRVDYWMWDKHSPKSGSKFVKPGYDGVSHEIDYKRPMTLFVGFEDQFYALLYLWMSHLGKAVAMPKLVDLGLYDPDGNRKILDLRPPSRELRSFAKEMIKDIPKNDTPGASLNSLATPGTEEDMTIADEIEMERHLAHVELIRIGLAPPHGLAEEDWERERATHSDDRSEPDYHWSEDIQTRLD